MVTQADMRACLLATSVGCLALAACGSSSGGPGSDASTQGETSGPTPEAGTDAAHPVDGGAADSAIGSDSAASDASSGEGSVGATIPCGPLTCNANTQYCYSASGGPPPPPDASGTSYDCKSIPPACLVNPACTCLEQEAGAACPCSVSDGGFYVTCEFP
jgi:hypothetical protein